MKNFRLVILDYASRQTGNGLVKQLLGDILTMKQYNFQRTNPDYIVTDKHDMIGTHYLVYDTTDIYAPQLIFALRTTFESRCKKHSVKTPFQDLLPTLSSEISDKYHQFAAQYPSIVDCNSWCVDANFSQKTSGLRLSDIGYVMVYLHLYRMGYNHFVGCTNEKYRASRWLENVGSFQKGIVFVHPVVPDPHMVILLNEFNRAYLSKVFHEYRSLFEQMVDVSDSTVARPMSETIREAITPQESSHDIMSAA